MGRLSWLVLGLGTFLAVPSTDLMAQGNQGSGPPPVAVGGLIYTQYAYALRSADDEGNANNFDVTRAYLTLTGRFAEGVGGRLTGDIYRNADGSLGYRLKYGYVQYRPNGSALTFKFGQFQTPYVGYNETLWDYRMQGSDPTDRARYLSSSDFGVGVEGSWNDAAVTLHSGIYNGEFYNKTPGDSHKDVAARLSVRLAKSDQSGTYGGLRLTGFALLGEPNGGGRRSRLLGQLSYRSKTVTLAATALTTRDRVDSTATAPTALGRLVSVMGVYNVPKSRFAVIGRFDWHDPDKDVDENALSRIVAGVSYRVGPNLRVLADLDHTMYQGPVSAATDAARSQALFQLELVF